MSTAIELLASIPSIIYGMWGLFVFVPFMVRIEPGLSNTLGRDPAVLDVIDADTDTDKVIQSFPISDGADAARYSRRIRIHLRRTSPYLS